MIMKCHRPSNYKIKLEEIELYVQTVTPSDILSRFAIIDALKISSVKYQIRCFKICLFSVSSGVTSWIQKNIMLEQLSHWVVFCFTRTNAIYGNYLLTMLHLQHFNINFFSFYVGGRQIPTKALQPNFAGNEADYVRSYIQMYSGVGTAFRNNDNAISYTPFSQESTACLT